MAPLPGYGLDEYGLGEYGGAETGLSITNAFAAAIRVVRVTLSSEPKHTSYTATGDALNPATWTVRRLDTNVFLTVLSVAEANPPLTYDIAVLEKLGDVKVTYEVKTTSLLSIDDEPISVPGNSFQFKGLKYVEDLPNAIAAIKRVAARDLANPPFPNDTQLSGTLQIVGNDYSLVDGIELLRKLIFRRITTGKGDFFHLPTYGVGIAIKELLPSTDMKKLALLVKEQIQSEPEVETAAVAASVRTPGILTLQLRVKVKKTGQQLDMPFEIRQDAFVSL